MAKVVAETKLMYPMAKLSMDPGRYLCNYAYLQSRHRLEKMESVNSLFIHVPHEWTGFDTKRSTIFGFIEKYCQNLYPQFYHEAKTSVQPPKPAQKTPVQPPMPAHHNENPIADFDNSYSDLAYKFMDFTGYSLQPNVQVFGENWRPSVVEVYYGCDKGQGSIEMKEFPRMVHALCVASGKATTPDLKDCLFLMQWFHPLAPVGLLSLWKFKEMCTNLQTRVSKSEKSDEDFAKKPIAKGPNFESPGLKRQDSAGHTNTGRPAYAYGGQVAMNTTGPKRQTIGGQVAMNTTGHKRQTTGGRISHGYTMPGPPPSHANMMPGPPPSHANMMPGPPPSHANMMPGPPPSHANMMPGPSYQGGPLPSGPYSPTPQGPPLPANGANHGFPIHNGPPPTMAF
jgi:hypothetical protein